MMMVRVRQFVQVQLLVLLGFSSAAHGTSAQAINPFEGMVEAKLTFLVGAGLDLERDNSKLSLFGDSPDARNQFEAEVGRTLAPVLRCAGIVLKQDSTNEISFNIYGRRETTSDLSSPHYVYLVETYVYNPKVDPEDYFELRPVIGTASPDAIQEVLVKTAIGLVAEQLDTRPLLGNRGNRRCSPPS